MSIFDARQSLHRRLFPTTPAVSLAARRIGRSPRTRAQTACGTSLYQSPELLRGNYNGAEVDVWAMGVVLARMAMCRVISMVFKPATVIGVEVPVDIHISKLESAFRPALPPRLARVAFVVEHSIAVVDPCVYKRCNGPATCTVYNGS